MEAFFTGILEIIVEFQNYIYVFIAIALLCLAVAGLLGGDDVKAKIKQNILWICFFAALGLGAVSFSNWIVGRFSF